MESLTRELVSNATAQLFPDKTLSSFTNFLPEQLNLEGQWEVAVSKTSSTSMYQNVTERKFLFSDKKTLKFVRILLSGTWSLPFHREIIEAMNILIPERHNHSENCITVKVSRITQKK